MKDPFGFAKKVTRPMWRKVGQIAAVILLVLSVTFGSLLVLSPQARAYAQRIVAQWFESYTAFRISGDGSSNSDLGTWYPTWLPEGYTLTREETAFGISTLLIYENEEEELLQLKYSLTINGTSVYLDNEHGTYKSVTVNDHPGYLLQGETSEDSSYLIWSDEEEHVTFHLTCRGSAEDLIQIATGIAQIN